MSPNDNPNLAISVNNKLKTPLKASVVLLSSLILASCGTSGSRSYNLNDIFGSSDTIQPEPTPEPPKEYKEYVVKSGDWLSKIGRAYGVEWRILAEYNALKNPNLIFPKQIIKIPQ